MNRSWYIGGFVSILFAIIIFQMIWLPDAFFFAKGKEWIQYIDQLYYVVIIIPLCWLIGAIWRSQQNQQRSLALTIMRIIVIMGSVTMIVILTQPLQHLQLLIIVTAITVVTIVGELVWSKVIDVRSNSQIVSKQFRHYNSSLIGPIVVYCIILLVLLCPTGYNVTYPGMTMNMNTYATIGQQRSENNGIIEGVLVFERPAFPIDWLYSAIFPSYEMNKREANEPSITETYSQVAEMKTDADKLAAAVAWEQAGLGEAIVYEGIQVIAIVANSPADGVIQAGDIVTAINGETLHDAAALITYMSSHVEAGDHVQIELLREGQQVKSTVSTVASTDGENRAVLGVSIQNAYRTQMEEELTFKSYLAHAGGPSHGAMLTLAFLDQLSEADLTGGLKIAGTGTIEPDGTVGMVGGIQQKAYAVSRTTADVFFVPKEGYLEATTGAPELNIVPVTSLRDILSWIEDHQTDTTL
ncbi:MAG: PDZ domain-containing protein [Candidatus Pristimantibacillus lignocellulolyticus]|uniref:PDZ domain-containing protein n=1 Tax=Candidatus Pristimantibacillus lignocellulolyticus TaxID=2994561 RepID=A0A9J6ZE53_9BACL|nr:MAG: PDZ domain-containing protein [Candidatus Pristimantibacillus lignocellulolyticus]